MLQIHHGFLTQFSTLFKQWKERYLVLTVEGSLRVCRDAESPPDQVVALQWNCEAIVEGREILDLPRLPPGGRRDCCFALILPQEKFLLLLADSPEDSADAFKTSLFKKKSKSNKSM
uniref:PH domain-containing protein n=1 Tax=Oncorhynchus mykiss TaxID=8022 RepID=A0A8K9WLU7_ONCMY